MQREALLTKTAVHITQLSNAREKISHITQAQFLLRQGYGGTSWFRPRWFRYRRKLFFMRGWLLQYGKMQALKIFRLRSEQR